MKIYVYGDACTPCEPTELEDLIRSGNTLIRLGLKGGRIIADCTVYTCTDDGELYVGWIVPTIDQGCVIPENWHEDVYELSDYDEWFEGYADYEWYYSDSENHWDNLGGSFICDFIAEWRRCNPGSWFMV